MVTAPIVGKHPPDKRDYRPMTWPIFLTLRNWARRVADAENAHVYLVGSALYRMPPRDVDVAIVLPRAVFEERFGQLPDTSDPEAFRDIWSNTAAAKVIHEIAIQVEVEWSVRVDVKFTPDCWYSDQDRLLLAAPDRIPT